MSTSDTTVIVHNPPRRRRRSKEYPPQMRIVLLGWSVSENSLVGNFILGRAAFDTEAPPDVVERVAGRLKDRHVIIINSPQLLQTNISDHQITQTVRECVHLSDPGPHVILLLLKHEPCSAEDQECVEKVLHSFSERVYQHTMVLSTQEPTQTNHILQEIIQKCANRHFSLQRSSSPDDLLQMFEDIVKMNDGRHLDCVEVSESVKLNLVVCGSDGTLKSSISELILNITKLNLKIPKSNIPQEMKIIAKRHKDPSVEQFICSMSEERGKDSPSEMSLSHKQSSVSVKSDCSKEEPPKFSEKRTSSTKSVRSGSHVSSSVSVKSDWSKGGEIPNFSGETASQTKRIRLQNETLNPDFQTNRNYKDFTNSFLQIFQDLESKIITFLKKELDKFKKILQKEDLQYFVKDFNENRCSIKEAALDLTLYFLREMKQDEAADTLEDELVFIHQLKCSLKKKYQCVLEGIAKQGDSTLLNNIYTDLYITQGCSEQVNTEHEVRQIEVASRRSYSQEIQVECTNLFEAPEQDKQIRTVLTKGVAGIGKSVSVQKFVLDWTEGKENQDIRFIFPLPFREMNLKEKEKLSLMDLITQLFPETKGPNLTRRNQKVLFILDGLDECRLPVNFKDNETLHDVSSPVSLDVLLTNLIKGNLLPSALIWITTRPAAASKIPPDCIDRLTDIRGFNDAQKEEYFRKRVTDENLAKEIIDHVKQSKSLFIMCHIPVFCWISATVLQNILEAKIKNVVKNNQADDASKTLQESNTEDTPKTLTQMYTHFLRFQIQQSRRKYDGEYTPDVSWDKDAIFSLGKLAFHQLERNNVIFYDTDLEACGIDVYKASVYSGMCTQIFKEETGIVLGTMYCFVHLSIQEFIAALYAQLNTKKKSIFIFKSENMIDLLKTTVDKALESDNGHLDLFLRFLLGLSLQSNRRLLQGLLTQQNDNDKSIKEIVWYIKQKLEGNLSPERSINLFYCLNELNDQTLVKDIQTHLSKGSLSSADLSPAQWSALAFVLLTSEEELEEFELQKFKKSDECLIRLSAVIKTSKRAL
ncbi:protein NLRC3-like [Garra rufa]|uniref:protein NLRC3-like n=1 Tax=Garra rufa TaxID=137080 RepID=UPI003CCE83CC